MNFQDFRKKHKGSSLLLANYLFIPYAFLLPISHFLAEQLFIFNLALFFFHGEVKEKLLFAFKNKVVQSFLLLYFAYIVWLFGTTNFDVALFKIKQYRFILYIIIYISMIQDEFKEKILSGFLFGIFFSEIISYSMLFNIHIPFIITNASSEYANYLTNVPFMELYTQYSLVLSITLGLVLYTLFTKKQSLIMKLLYGFFFLSSSINIFIIPSKLGYGLYLLSILIVLIYLSKKHISKKVIILIPVIALITYFIAYNNSTLFNKRVHIAYNDIVKIYNYDDYTTAIGIRFGFYKASFSVLKDHFFFGVGTGDHMNEVKKVTDTYTNFHCNNYYSGNNTGLESEFLDTFVQLGFIGLIIFILIFYRVASSPTSGIFTILKYLLVVLMFTMSLPSYIFIYTDIGKIFLLLSTLTLVTYPNINSKKRNT